MTTTNTWIGGGAMLAAIHVPENGLASTGVVICPPIAQEHILAYRTLRLLAERLAESGLAAIRFDYPGFGDSTVAIDADSLETGAALAARELRQLGCARIVYLGLASGALVASTAAMRDKDAAGLVLWDAPASGRSWLRRARALYRVSVLDSPHIGDVELPASAVSIVGADLAPEVAERIGTMHYQPPEIPVLLAVRRSSSLPEGLASVQDIIEVDDHDDLFDRSGIAPRIPESSVEAVVGWCAGHFGSSRGMRLAIPVETPSVRFRTTRPDGSTVELEERIVRIGANELFAIETVNAEDPSEGGVVLHSGSSEHRIGVNGHQVELARRLAAGATRVLRVDRRGTGESGPVRAAEPSLLFSSEWVEDGEEAVRHLRLPRERAGVVGMCVGAWVGLKTDPALISFVIGLSPNDYRLEPAQHGAVAASEAAMRDSSGPTRRHRAVAWMKRNLPYPLLWALARCDLVQLVEPLLVEQLDRAVDVTFVVGPLDAEIFDERRGARAAARLRTAPGSLTVVRHPTGDHALFTAGIRERAVQESVAAVEAAITRSSRRLDSVSRPGHAAANR